MLPGFASLTADLTGARAVQLPAGSSLAIVAGEPDPGRRPRDVVWSNSRVTITGDIEVTGVRRARPARPQADAGPARAAPDQRHLAGRPAARDRRAAP